MLKRASSYCWRPWTSAGIEGALRLLGSQGGTVSNCTATSAGSTLWCQYLREGHSLAKEHSAHPRDTGTPEKSTSAARSAAGQQGILQETAGSATRPEQSSQALPVTFQTDLFAPLSAGSCLLQCGKCQIVARVDIGPAQKRGSRHPVIHDAVSVMFQERSSASWRFPMQGHTRRQTSTEEQSVVADLIEAAILPQLPPGFNRVVQVSATLHSHDERVDTAAMAINAVSAALMDSSLPWAGPVGAVKVDMLGNGLSSGPQQWMPTAPRAFVTYVGRKNGVVVVDMQGKPTGQGAIGLAVEAAAAEANSLIEQQLKLERKPPSVTSFHLAGADVAARQRIFDAGKTIVTDILSNTDSQPWEIEARLEEARENILEDISRAGFYRNDHMRVAGSGAVSPRDMSYAWSDLVATCVQEQVMSTVTVGNSKDLPPIGHATSPRRQLSAVVADSLKSKSGTGFRYKGTTKGERAYAHFVEGALSPLLPTERELPFALRVDLDILSDDGAAADTALNSAALALQNAKVPLAEPIAAASVSLISDAPKAALGGSMSSYDEAGADSFQPTLQSWDLVTDPQELEELAADMSLWAAGTETGLVALRMTCSIPGIPQHIFEAALNRVRAAQIDSLQSMCTQVTRRDRQGPEYGKFRVAKEQIPTLIGAGGENMRALETQTGTRLTLRAEDKALYFVSPDPQCFAAAEAMMSRLVGQDMKEGDTYTGKVVKIVDYGAYIALPSGPQVLLHISELSHSKVKQVQDILEVGQSIEVKYLGKDKRNFHKISHKACLPLPLPSQIPAEAEAGPSSRQRMEESRVSIARPDDSREDNSSRAARGRMHGQLSPPNLRGHPEADSLQIGKEYTAKLAVSRRPKTGSAGLVATVRSPDGSLRRLKADAMCSEGVSSQDGCMVTVIYNGLGRCTIVTPLSASSSP